MKETFSLSRDKTVLLFMAKNTIHIELGTDEVIKAI